MPPDLTTLPVAVVGAGAVGRVLALGLREAGLDVQAVLSRSAPRAQALATEIGGAEASSDLEALPRSVRLVLVCTPDAAIEPVARALAALDHPWPETWVAHTSGALSVEALSMVEAAGAHVLGFHPLQTLTRHSAPEVLRGAYAGVEEEGREGGVGVQLADRLGMRPLFLEGPDKARYHLAAALASNGLVALMGAVADVLGTLGVGREEASGLMLPLLDGTLRNLAAGSPEAALTGPIARADVPTVERHLNALSGDLDRLRPLYAALQEEAVRLAIRGGKLEAEQAAALRGALSSAGGLPE